MTCQSAGRFANHRLIAVNDAAPNAESSQRAEYWPGLRWIERARSPMALRPCWRICATSSGIWFFWRFPRWDRARRITRPLQRKRAYRVVRIFAAGAFKSKPVLALPMVRPDLASLLNWRSSIVSASDVSLREAKFIMQAPTLGYCHYRPPKKLKSPAAGIDRFNLGGRACIITWLLCIRKVRQGARSSEAPDGVDSRQQAHRCAQLCSRTLWRVT